MNGWIVAATAKADGWPELQLGWMGLIIPVSALAITAITRAFTAETRVLKDCRDDVTAVRDSVLTGNVRPVLAALIVRIRPYLNFDAEFLPGEPGDPEIEARRVLGANPTFAESYSNLESHYAEIHQAQSVHDRRVAHAKRIGWAATVFLPAWVYFGLWLCLPSVNFPSFVTGCVLSIGAGSLGWIGAEALGSVRERNALSHLARRARISGGSTR